MVTWFVPTDTSIGLTLTSSFVFTIDLVLVAAMPDTDTFTEELALTTPVSLAIKKPTLSDIDSVTAPVALYNSTPYAITINPLV